MPTFTYERDGQTHTVRLDADGDGWTAHIDGRTYRLKAQRIGEGWRLTFEDGDAALVVVAADGDQRHIWHDGEQVTLRAASEQRIARRASAAVEDAQLSAQMPGQVRAVLVGVGDRVVVGQPLMIMEAMKMELRVTARRAGVVARVWVEVGQVVERGALLIEIGMSNDG
jgi:biotin carboxyl carrier protein